MPPFLPLGITQENWNMRLHKNLDTNVHSSVSHNSQKNGNNPKVYHLTSGQSVYIHTMKYYSAIKKNEALTHTIAWINPENIMPSERSQTHKATCRMTLWRAQNRQSSRQKQMSSCWGEGGDNGERLLSRYLVSYGGEENIPEFDSGDGCTTPGMH